MATQGMAQKNAAPPDQGKVQGGQRTDCNCESLHCRGVYAKGPARSGASVTTPLARRIGAASRSQYEAVIVARTTIRLIAALRARYCPSSSQIHSATA